jgi:integrase
LHIEVVERNARSGSGTILRRALPMLVSKPLKSNWRSGTATTQKKRLIPMLTLLFYNQFNRAHFGEKSQMTICCFANEAALLPRPLRNSADTSRLQWVHSAIDQLLAVVNPIAESGRIETAHGVRSRFSQIFRYAAARGLCTHDPASVIIDAMISRQAGEYAGITEPKEVRKLLQSIHEYRKQHIIVGSALLLSAYLFTRNTELRGMQWAEIDWDTAIWEIPGERMKANRDHIVPLPRQALGILSELKEIDFGSKFVFPSPREPGRMLSNMAFNAALRRMGYTNDVHVHHGFRTTASTNLNEMGWNSDWIERQLAHVPANKVRASYNKAEYLDGRRKMMQAYANWLDGDLGARNS